MKRKTLLLLASLIAAGAVLSSSYAPAQDAVNAPRPNVGWTPGRTCTAGYVLTYFNGQLVCINRVARTNSAAATARTRALDPSTQIDASQVRGKINPDQIDIPVCEPDEYLTGRATGLTCYKP